MVCIVIPFSVWYVSLSVVQEVAKNAMTNKTRAKIAVSILILWEVFIVLGFCYWFDAGVNVQRAGELAKRKTTRFLKCENPVETGFVRKASYQ
jgi:hypothetical protein